MRTSGRRGSARYRTLVRVPKAPVPMQSRHQWSGFRRTDLEAATHPRGGDGSSKSGRHVGREEHLHNLHSFVSSTTGSVLSSIIEQDCSHRTSVERVAAVPPPSSAQATGSEKHHQTTQHTSLAILSLLQCCDPHSVTRTIAPCLRVYTEGFL